jgi:hypothetical protein
MIPKPTEDTITNLLAKELEKYGVKTQTFPSIQTPSGIRKPDIWCANGGVYPIESKFTERDLFDAVSKVQNDYLRWFDVLEIKGGFALLYPEQLSQPLPLEVIIGLAHKLKFKAVAMFPPKDTRKNFAVYEGPLPEIAAILAKHILSPPEYVEPSTEYIIRTLQNAAIYITATLRYLTGKELEDLFGGKEVFGNILQYEAEKYPVEALRLASAYLLINQILFYHVLSARVPEKFPDIDPDTVKKPADLNEYFAKVLDVNYRTVFSYDVASKIPPGFAEQVKAVIAVVKGLTPEKVGGDLLGTIFHDLVPFEVRKTVAAFYTNVLAAELLAWLSIDAPDTKVADFAVGSGGLLVAAYRRKRFLLEREKGRFSPEDHRNFLEKELLGIDVMPFAASVAACHLALQTPEYFTNRVNVAIWDSTELSPGRVIPSIAGLEFVMRGQTDLEAFVRPPKKRKGVVSLTGEVPKEIALERYDVAIMNPPFTRQERMPEKYKNALVERFKDYSDYIKGQMGYYGYFVHLADLFLKDCGRMALVLPATTLHVRSSEGIRRLWAEKYHVEYIITTWHRLAFSESVIFREILLVAKKTRPTSDAVTKVCILKKLPDKMSKAREIAERIKSTSRDYEDEDIVIKIHPYSKFTADTTDWHTFISLSNLKLVDFLEEILASKKLTPMSPLAEARRSDLEHFKFREFHGFVLSSVERAIRQSDVWIADRIKGKTLIAKHRERVQEVEIPLDSLKRALRRFSYTTTIDVGKTLDYLITGWFKGVGEMAGSIVPVNALKKFDTEVVQSWAKKFEERKAHLLLGRRLYLSAPGTSLISFYSNEQTAGIDLWGFLNLGKTDSKILSLWMNSTFNILQLLYMGVACEGPWMKLHDYMMDRLLVPDPKKLTKSEKNQILDLFEKVREIEFPSLSEQLETGFPARKTIDLLWLKILGYKGPSEALLEKLYGSLLNELKIIDRLMSGTQPK